MEERGRKKMEGEGRGDERKIWAMEGELRDIDTNCVQED